MLTPIIKTKAICRQADVARDKLGSRKLGARGMRARGKKLAARGGRLDLLADAVNGIQLVETRLALDL
jgi:hypothetical protein